jgi:Flp pilus assembly protein CpaB
MAQRLSRGTLSIVLIATAVGLVAAVGVRSLLQQEEPIKTPPPPPPEIKTIPVAATDLPADRLLGKFDFVTLHMSVVDFKKKYPKVDPNQVLNNPLHIINRRLKEPMKRGDPFISSKFYLEGTGPSIAKRLQPGFRAIRVQVPVTREAAVRPGMYVDVYFRADSKKSGPGQLAIPEKTLILFRNLEVLESEPPGAHGKRTGNRNEWYFTLAVPEDKADYFTIIEKRGELWLVPTPEAGSETSPEVAAIEVADVSTLTELLGIKPLPPPPAPFETAIYRRGQYQINKFIEGKLVTTRYGERGGRYTERTNAPVSTLAPAESPATLPEERE